MSAQFWIKRAAAAGKARTRWAAVAVLSLLGILLLSVVPRSRSVGQEPAGTWRTDVMAGRQIFRHDTFGNEPFWTQQLGLHEVIQNFVDPITALELGLKVDADRVPPGLLASADLGDPQTTVELLRRDAVVGLRAKVVEDDETGELRIAELGTTCALCHSTVDDAVAPGIGYRLDGWPNLDLDVGAILATSHAIPDEAKNEFLKWGPGRYDPYFNQDGMNIPVVIPPAYGLQGVPLETYLGVGPISYWNAYVAVTQMHGQGSFVEPLLGINIQERPDRVTPKLSVLLAYQLSLEAPAPPEGLVDPAAADRGREIFLGKAHCAECHIPPTFTDAPRLWDPDFIPTDPSYANRPASITGQWRTTPLRGLWQHAPYFHDGSAETLADVVDVYDDFFELDLSDEEKGDLVEFLQTL